jgi:hypothetical protein
MQGRRGVLATVLVALALVAPMAACSSGGPAKGGGCAPAKDAPTRVQTLADLKAKSITSLRYVDGKAFAYQTPYQQQSKENRLALSPNVQVTANQVASSDTRICYRPVGKEELLVSLEDMCYYARDHAWNPGTNPPTGLEGIVASFVWFDPPAQRADRFAAERKNPELCKLPAEQLPPPQK